MTYSYSLTERGRRGGLWLAVILNGWWVDEQVYS